MTQCTHPQCEIQIYFAIYCYIESFLWRFHAKLLVHREWTNFLFGSIWGWILGGHSIGFPDAVA